MNNTQKMFSLEHEVIIITGGAGVIAQSFSAGFLQSGAKISLWGRSMETLEQAKRTVLQNEEFNAEHIQLVKADCTNKEALERAFQETVSRLGTPTCLVNNVGGNKSKNPFLEEDPKVFMEVLELNLLAGLILPSQIVCKYWIEHNIKGRIVNLSSMTSYEFISGVWGYNAAKTAVIRLTQGMAREFAGYGIRVNSIAPGFFLGKQNKPLLVEKDEPFTLTPRGAKIIARTPMGRFGDHQDLQGVAIFLLSENASKFITGIDIPVDGGFLTDGI